MISHDFEQQVAQDVRGQLIRSNPAASKALRSPEQVNDWYDTLCKLKRDVEEQFSAHHSRSLQLRAEYSVARELGTKITVTRVLLDINGNQREVSNVQAETLTRKADRHNNDIQEIETYNVDVDPEVAWQIHLADEANWQTNTKRFRNAIERDIAEARRLRRTYSSRTSAQHLSKLIGAVQRHRDEIGDGDEADDDLYAILDEITDRPHVEV